MYEKRREFWLNYFRGDSKFALPDAVVHGDVAKVRQLLTSGTDINKIEDVPWSSDQYGTPLHVAIWCNQLDIFELLIIEGADFNILDEGSEGRPPDTPIRLAVRLGRRAMFARLWNAGAERKKYPSDWGQGRSLIEVAASEGSADILTDLLSWNQSWTHDEQLQALTAACRQWFPDSVAALIRERPCFSKKELEDSMHMAVTGEPTYHDREWVTVQERLLTLEEDSFRQERILIMLLDEWDRVGVADGVAHEPSQLLDRLLLVVSISLFSIAALRLLLERGADPNALNKSTPLHRALGSNFRVLKQCNEAGVEALLKYGARVDIKNNKGETAMDIAKKNGDTRMMERLMQHIRDVERAEEA
jgi:ankyrin repeat protein